MTKHLDRHKRSASRALGLGLAAAIVTSAPEAFAATSNAFAPTSGGPRIAALGGHLVALLDDDHALEQNPARLVYAGRSVSFQVDQLHPDLDLWRGRAGVSVGLGEDLSDPFQKAPLRSAAIGASIEAMNLKLIEWTAYREATLALGVGVAALEFVSLGASVRYERAFADVPGLEARGFGVDAGLGLSVSDHWSAGLAIRDVFGRVKYEDSDDEDRAARLTLGVASIGWRRWQAEVDYVFQDSRTAALAGGVEVRVLPEVLDLRAGLSRETRAPARTIASAGAGFLFHGFRLDYAYANDADGAMAHQHRVALAARF